MSSKWSSFFRTILSAPETFPLCSSALLRVRLCVRGAAVHKKPFLPQQEETVLHTAGSFELFTGELCFELCFGCGKNEIAVFDFLFSKNTAEEFLRILKRYCDTEL